METNGSQCGHGSLTCCQFDSFNASNFTVYDLFAPCSNDWHGIICSYSVSNCAIPETHLKSLFIKKIKISWVGSEQQA
jgi:hypothetical protein